jgi:uncharacterized HAD superfamily protein
LFRLGLDIDGCINDFSEMIYRYASIFSESHGIDKDYDMSDYLIERHFGWSEYMNHEFWTKYYKQAMANTVPLPAAVQTISLLKRNNIEIYLITARKEKLREITINWLNRYNIQYDKLIMTREKAQACVENRIDIMIEDEPGNCEAVAAHIPVLCMAYKYNEGLEGKGNIMRVDNWAEVYNEVMELARQGQVV